MGLILVALLSGCLLSFVSADLQGDALVALRSSLRAPADQLTDWNQNLVSPCTWSNVRCDGNNVISVTLSSMNLSGTLSPKIGVLSTLSSLTLKGNGITGEIPEELGNLSSLTSLDLENNRLAGEIPSSLGNLKNLKFLTLSKNNLSGTVPRSISGLQKLINLLLDSNDLSGEVPEILFNIQTYDFTGNKLNCGQSFPHSCVSNGNDSGSSHKPNIGIIVGIVGGFISLLFGGLLFLTCKRRRKGYKGEIFEDVAGEVDQRIAFGQLTRFAWRELQLATDNFSEKNVLGQGGFGKVYKGVLSDSTKVAFKRLIDFESPGGDAAFQREVEMISVAVYRNLLRLIGFCTTPTERLLIYPFMPNLSVACRLRGASSLRIFIQHVF